jgi:hypothetical protein
MQIMSFLEPIIAALIGAAAAAAAGLIRKNATAANILKYGPIIKKAYDIIDPVLDKNLGRWDGSKVDRAFELSIESVADGKLSSDEIKKLAFEMAKNWLPQKAADKVRAMEASSPQFLVASQITSKVDALAS